MLNVLHEININLNLNWTANIRGLIFDISKDFDEVWLRGLLFELKSYGTHRPLSGMSPGPVLGFLSFLIYINRSCIY